MAADSSVYSSKPSTSNSNLSSSKACSIRGQSRSSSHLFSQLWSNSLNEHVAVADSEIIFVHKANGTHTGRDWPHFCESKVNRGDSCNRSMATKRKSVLFPLPGPPRMMLRSDTVNQLSTGCRCVSTLHVRCGLTVGWLRPEVLFSEGMPSNSCLEILGLLTSVKSGMAMERCS